MLQYECFPFFSRFAWHIVEIKDGKKRVITAARAYYPDAQSCRAEVEKVRGKNVEVPIVFLPKELK